MSGIPYSELKPGQKVRITQTVKVGNRSWPSKSEGTVRDVKRLVTGLATERNSDDIFSVATIHFRKENGELSCVTVDESTVVEVL